MQLHTITKPITLTDLVLQNTSGKRSARISASQSIEQSTDSWVENPGTKVWMKSRALKSQIRAVSYQTRNPGPPCDSYNTHPLQLALWDHRTQTGYSSCNNIGWILHCHMPQAQLLMEGDSCLSRPSQIFPIAVLCGTNMISLKMMKLDSDWGVEWNDMQNHFKERLNLDLPQAHWKKGLGLLHRAQAEITKQHNPPMGECGWRAAGVTHVKLRHSELASSGHQWHKCNGFLF